MKLTKLLILLTLLLGICSASADAQRKTETGKDKKAEKTAKAKSNKSDRDYLVGSKGGCYYLNSSGKKSYVDKKFCESIASPMFEVKIISNKL